MIQAGPALNLDQVAQGFVQLGPANF